MVIIDLSFREELNEYLEINCYWLGIKKKLSRLLLIIRGRQLYFWFSENSCSYVGSDDRKIFKKSYYKTKLLIRSVHSDFKKQYTLIYIRSFSWTFLRSLGSYGQNGRSGPISVKTFGNCDFPVVLFIEISFLLSNFIKFSLLHKVIYKFYTFQDVTWNFWLFLLQDHLKFHTRPDPDVLSLLPHSLKESNEKRLFVENNFPASISTRAFQAFSLRSEKLYKNKFNHFPFIFMF